MEGVDESYILLLLADSNLPTGSFVASSGLESYLKHGFGEGDGQNKTVTFLQYSLDSYARTSLPFVSDAHLVMDAFRNRAGSGSSPEDSDHGAALEETLIKLAELDGSYHVMTVNHVTRRASKTQGVALLTLYSKGFSRPPLSQFKDPQPDILGGLVDKYKLMVRREQVQGHLPICWGVLTAALGLSLGSSSIHCVFVYPNEPCVAIRTVPVPSSVPSC
jgi:urease accessory protein